ncbi:MAG TPA: ABATE domain-containing protein [Holophagaceae bacterium]|nr:ABATE domain-containing protein [Holophagaceae bacterium]
MLRRPPTPPGTPPSGAARDGFVFRAGRLALDFTATLAGRKRATPRDRLAAPEDLGRWFVAAGLASRAPRVTEADLASARALREALYRLARAALEGDAYPAKDLALANRWAAQPPPVPQLGPEGLTWRAAATAALLAAVARDGLELLGGPSAAGLRACEGEGCALLFLDTSRGGRRRWCAMAACGNREKVGAFRLRQREG